MARRTGVNGSIEIENVAVGNVLSWTYTATANTGEVTTVGDEDQQYDYTTRTGTFSVNAQFEETDTEAASLIDNMKTGGTLAKVWVELITEDGDGDKFSFSAVINSLEVGVSANEIDTFVINGTKTGSLLAVPTTT